MVRLVLLVYKAPAVIQVLLVQLEPLAVREPEDRLGLQVRLDLLEFRVVRGRLERVVVMVTRELVVVLDSLVCRVLWAVLVLSDVLVRPVQLALVVQQEEWATLDRRELLDVLEVLEQAESKDAGGLPAQPDCLEIKVQLVQWVLPVLPGCWVCADK